MCGNTLCELPPPEDPAWRETFLEAGGTTSPLPHEEGVAWIRLTFALPGVPPLVRPALLLPNPPDAVEFSLNGTRIGSQGLIDTWYVTTPFQPLLIKVPPQVLRAGENHLTMRALFTGKNAKILDAPLRLGEVDLLAEEGQRLLVPIIASEAAFLSVFLFILVFYGLLIFQGVVRSDYLIFSAFTATYAVTFLLGSHLLWEVGLSSPWSVKLQVILAAVTPLLILALVTDATGNPSPRVYRILMACGLALLLLEIILPPLVALNHLTLPRKVFSLVRIPYYILVSIQAMVRQREESAAVLLGVALFVTGSRLELFWGIAMRDYAMGGFALCMLYAMTSRHARFRERLVAISASLLRAHEEERRRIARDIHDSIGQSLLALKLALQMLAKRGRRENLLPPDSLEGPVKDITAIIEDVRRTSLDLRPSFLETMSLPEAIAWYGSHLMERHPLKIKVHGEAGLPEQIPPVVKDNLFRIFQEILSNAIRHSGATTLEISLYRKGRGLVLQAADNGRGFDPQAGDPHRLGLSTMQERAELLGGSCRIASAPERGTTITVEVPLS
jgi:signal transduction histidine kinase